MAAGPDPPADADTTPPLASPNPAIHAARARSPTLPASWETNEASAALDALSGPRRAGSPGCAAAETRGESGEWAAGPAVPQFSQSVGRLIACRLAPQRLGSSGEGAGDSAEESSGGSIHSSGFLSPQSSPHSDLRPKPTTPAPGGDPVKRDPIKRIETMSWFHFPLPNLHLPHYQTKEYWWLPCAKDLPRIAHLHHPPPTKEPGTKSVTFIYPDQITDSINRMRSHTATPAISQRWNSTGLDDPRPPEPESSTSSRRRIVATDSGADALSAIRAKLTRQGSQRGTPTIVTLRRASAVLDTIAQRQLCVADDFTTALPLHTSRGKIQDKVPVAYLVMREEIKLLQSPRQKTAADGLPSGGKTAKTVNGASLVPRPRLAADVALTVADVHAHARFSRSRSRRRRSRVTSHRSCVITTGERRSVHDIVWEKDGRPQEVRSRSEAWSLSPRPDQPGRRMRRMM